MAPAVATGPCAILGPMVDEPSDDDIELARELLALWDEGRGISKDVSG